MGSKYEALTGHLLRRSEAVVELTFTELERLVGGLPASARRQQAWWSNTRHSQPHARYWLDAGRRASADFNGGRVRFTLGAESPGAGRARRGGSARSFPATGEVVEAAIRFDWLDAGRVTLDADGKALLPRLPNGPGIYRFSLRRADDTGLSVYIGESDDLARRMAGYRNPGPSQHTNLRMAARFTSVLADGGTADLTIATSATIDDEPLDLSSRPVRLLVENAALVRAGAMGTDVENL